MSYSYNTSSGGGGYSPNPYSGGSYAPNTYASSYTYANQQNNNWDDYEHEYYEQQYNEGDDHGEEEEDNQGEEEDDQEEEDDDQEEEDDDQEDDCQEEEDDCQEEEDDCQEEEDDCQEEEADNGYTELYRDDPIVGKCYFIAYIDSKDIDYSQHNNWKYYAPHNNVIYMGEFQRLKSISGGHTGSTTYYFSEGFKVAAEYTPLICFLEA
jgi:hypothetical protein